MLNDPRRRMTRADVANKAGVATGTVSHVLSGKPNVSPEIREKVMKAVEELGYRPNRIAGGLRAKRTRQLGLISPRFDNPHFGDIVSGVQQEAAARDYVVVSAETGQKLSKIIDTFVEWRVDAVVLSAYGNPHELKALIDEGIPLVTCGYAIPELPQLPWIMPDHEGGTKAGVDHVVSLGHSKIGLLAGAGTVESDERLKGWLKALDHYGIKPDPVIEGFYDQESGTNAARRFLDSAATCVLVANDLMAFALMGELMRLGARVPDDISILGYDDIWLCRHAYPSLSSVRIFSRELGVQAAKAALDSAMGLAAGSLRHRTELVPRQSTGKPRG